VTFVGKLVEPFLCRGTTEKLAGEQINFLSIGHGLVNVGVKGG
jgi:hypothetical protein